MGDNKELHGAPESSDCVSTEFLQSSQEVKPVSTQAIREYLLRVWTQYNSAEKRLKSQILDEVVRNLGVHRKAAIRLLRKPWPPRSQQGIAGGRGRKYSLEAKEHLALLWSLMGYMCGERMKAALPEWLNYTRHKGCTDAIKSELLSMSASSINRFLKDERAKLQRRMNSGTRRGVRSFVTKVPVRDLEHTPTDLGHCEIDCVAHCGSSLSGTFAWTLTLTDIASGWTECEALWGKDGVLVENALARIEKRLPFAIKGLYFDNGSEFMNKHVVDHFTKKNRLEVIPVYRGRPRRKNDQCYVEQKNYTHVRTLFGYSRIDWKEGADMMNDIYRHEWRLLQNYFMPQQKLISKRRLGAKVKRKMGKACTPYDRIMPLLEMTQQQAMSTHKSGFNPFQLRHNQRLKVQKLNRHPKNNTERTEWGKMAL